MNSPTIRKVRNRGFEPVRYHDADSIRHGWIIARFRTRMRVQLVGDEGPKFLPLEEERYMQVLS